MFINKTHNFDMDDIPYFTFPNVHDIKLYEGSLPKLLLSILFIYGTCFIFYDIAAA